MLNSSRVAPAHGHVENSLLADTLFQAANVTAFAVSGSTR